MNGNLVRALFFIEIIVVGAFCLNGCSDSKAETAKSEQAEAAEQGQTGPGDITGPAIDSDDDQGIPVLMYHSISDKKGS